MRGVLPALASVLLSGCILERVTGDEVPLDPRFYKAIEQAQGLPGVGGGSSVPFSSSDEDKITVRGVIESTMDMGVDLDIRVPDSTAPGGMRGEGKVLVEGPGPFELQVPKDLGGLELQAFQDQMGDGPTGEDHFGQIRVEVGDEDVDIGTLELVQGARSGGPEHTEAPPGAPGGAPGAPGSSAGDPGGGGSPGQGSPDGGPGEGQVGPGVPEDPEPAPAGSPGGSPMAGGAPQAGGGGMAPFSDHDGSWVTLSGTLTVVGSTDTAVVDLDLFQPDKEARGGRRMLGKQRLDSGAYELEVPSGYGPLILEAFIDVGGDGPGRGDPMGAYAGNPLVVGRSDVSGIDITLEQTADGKMPRSAADGRQGGGL